MGLKREYDYLGESKVRFEADAEYLERIGKNFEEEPGEYGEFNVRISINKKPERKIVRNPKFPFASAKINSLLGVDFFRYNTQVQTIFRPQKNRFEIDSYIPRDESGALRCFKIWYSEQSPSLTKAKAHASLVAHDKEGILIAGNPFSGKTTLTVNLLEKLGLNFIAEENTFIERRGDALRGFYIPGPIHLRINIAANSERLYPLLEGINKLDATQNIDEDAIYRIVKARAFNVDASLNISRKNFASFLGVNTSPNCTIKQIIFPKYANGIAPSIRSIGANESYLLLRDMELSKKGDLSHVKKAYEQSKPEKSLVSETWTHDISSKIISFNGSKDLTSSLLEDLLS